MTTDRLKSSMSELLAAERTFLAWVRTSLAILTLGFVVAKFGFWLRELALQFKPGVAIPSTHSSVPAGIGMMAFGALLTIFAAWHFHVVGRAIERGEMATNRSLVVALTAIICIFAGTMIVYMLRTAGSL